jgi:RimJ/RimL family protein N-acetyltransferase
MEIVFRSPCEKDYPAFQPFIDKIAAETSFTNQYPGRPPEDREKCLAKWRDLASFFLCAFDGPDMVGSIGLYVKKPEHPWIKHVGGFGLSVAKDYWGRGIGGTLLQKMEDEAGKRGLKRIEGRVRAENARALALYKKAGFEIEGTHRAAAIIDGEPVDEYTIAKLL